MSDIQDVGIQQYHEAFYLEAMLYCTTAALRAADDVRVALELGKNHEPHSSEWRECAQTIIDGVQSLVLQAAALSRYFWPARPREPYRSRAVHLREGLRITDDSPLRNRDIRNHLEHFDERLDVFCREALAGVVLPTYVGPMPDEPDVPKFHFRAYYTDVGMFEILGYRFEVQPLLNEVQVVHDRLLDCARNGGRLLLQDAES